MNTDRIGALVTALPWVIAGALLLAVLWAATHREMTHRSAPPAPTARQDADRNTQTDPR